MIILEDSYSSRDINSLKGSPLPQQINRLHETAHLVNPSTACWKYVQGDGKINVYPYWQLHIFLVLYEALNNS